MLFVLKCSARALAIVSIALSVVGALMSEGSVLGRAVPGDFQVEPAVRALGDVAPGAVVSVNFRAANRSSHPIRLVGINEMCASWGCVRAKNLPCVVPPHASADIALSVLTTSRPLETALDFDQEIALHSDCPGRSVIPVRVSGKVVPADAGK